MTRIFQFEIYENFNEQSATSEGCTVFREPKYSMSVKFSAIFYRFKNNNNKKEKGTRQLIRRRICIFSFILVQYIAKLVCNFLYKISHLNFWCMSNFITSRERRSLI